MADLATLQIKVDASGAISAVDQFGKSSDTAAKKTGLLTASTRKLAAGFLTLGTATLVLKKFVDATSVAQFAQAQLASALKSTSNAAGQSVSALNRHAAALQKVTTFGDDAINGAQALLLTFTKIQGDTFPKATEAVLNVATAMGTDLKSAAVQVGKALNDPILGVTALARSGIQFTQSQKDTIKTLVETGRQAQAQTIILKELETQFGGSAKAARDTLGGALKALGESFGDLFEISKESSGGVVKSVEAITTALQFLNEVITDFNKPKPQQLGDLTVAQREANAFAASAQGKAFIARRDAEQEAAKAAEQAREEAERQAVVLRAQAGHLTELAKLTSLSASEMKTLRDVNADYATSLRAGNLPLEERVKLMQQQLEIQNAMSAQQRRGLESQSASALERLRSTITSPRSTTVSTAGLGAMAAQGQAGIAQNVIATQAKMEMEAREKSLLAEHNLRENLQMELAKNFRENMQRAFGDVLTEFVTKGKVSIGGLFDSLKQIGGSMVGQGVSKGLSGLFGALKMTPFGSIVAGGALALAGNLFGRRRRPSAGQDGNQQARFEAGEAARLEREQEMRDFVAGRNGGRGGVIQSVGQVLQETSASRMIGELVAIRVATTRTADAVAGGTLTGGAGTTVNVTVQGGAAGNLNGVAEQVAEAVDRLLGTRVQGLRLTSGSAVTI
jgi:hypothetical protein